LIDALAEIVTDVGAPLLVNVAVPAGTSGLELQLAPVVHSTPGPVQVPSVACAGAAAAHRAASRAPADTVAARRQRRTAARAAKRIYQWGR
jgi:hypothetical protein